MIENSDFRPHIPFQLPRHLYKRLLAYDNKQVVIVGGRLLTDRLLEELAREDLRPYS